jgi:hypothetical protein
MEGPYTNRYHRRTRHHHPTFPCQHSHHCFPHSSIGSAFARENFAGLAFWTHQLRFPSGCSKKIKINQKKNQKKIFFKKNQKYSPNTGPYPATCQALAAAVTRSLGAGEDQECPTVANQYPHLALAFDCWSNWNCWNFGNPGIYSRLEFTN